MLIEQIAKTCHEANRAYCEALGDTSQAPWAAAPEWQRESARKGVLMHIENPQATPEDSHISWLNDKISQGWKYGPVKDADKKEHPCCVSYNQLPVEQRAKDYIFRAIVRTLAPMTTAGTPT